MMRLRTFLAVLALALFAAAQIPIAPSDVHVTAGITPTVPWFLGKRPSSVTHVAAGTTLYFPPVMGANAAGSDASHEADATITHRTARTVSSLCVQVISNTLTADSTLQFRRNGSDGATVTTVTAGTTGIVCGTGSDAYAPGDTASLRFVAGGTGTDILISTMRFLVKQAVYATLISNNSVGGFTKTTTATAFTGFAGDARVTATESAVALRAITPCTLQNAQARIGANTFSGSTVIKLRKNGADGNITLTVPSGSGATTVFDTTNTDTVANLDLIDWSETPSGTGSITTVGLAVECLTPTAITPMYGGTINEQPGNGNKVWNMPAGTDTVSDNQTPVATITDVQMTYGVPGTIQNCKAQVATNASTGNIFHRLMVNQASAASVTIEAGGTGTRSFSPSSVTIAASDLVVFESQYADTNLTVYPSLQSCLFVPQ